MTPPPTDAAACEPDKCPDCGMVLSVGAKACNERLVAAIEEKDARIRELVGLVRELLESGEWFRSMAEDGSPIDELTKRAEAALARSEGGSK